MSCNDINGINGSSCTKSMGGLKNIWMFPFDAIDEYIYTSDYLHKITGYSSTIVPVEYTPNYSTSEYKATEALGPYKMYDHSLNLSFSKMEASKREELIKLESMELTIIFQDRNDICWIMGQDFPVKLSMVEVGSGVKGGNSLYDLTFTSKEKNHLREIERPSDACFVSFKGIENRESTFLIPNASLLNWTDFAIGADDQILSYSSPSPLDPVNWGTPSVLSADLLQLSYLINQYGTSVVPGSTLFGAYFGGGSDIAVITIFSPDTTYGAFEVDNTVTASTVRTVLYLSTTVSPLIANPSTIINVNDSLGNLYSAAYGSTVSGTGLSGIAQNSIIQVSDLYPSGTTFTMSISGLACATNTYEYVIEPTIDACEILMNYDFYKGQEIKMNVPYVIGHVGCPKYQNIHINIHGQIYTLYTIYTDWHSDDTQFENDLINLFNQTSIAIDTGTMSFVHSATGVDISFKIASIVGDSDNYYFKPYVRGYDQPVFTNTAWNQARILALNTAAPYPSIVSIEDEYGNIVKGENLDNITSNITYTLGDAPGTTNTSIDNVGLVWSLDSALPYSETSTLEISADAAECLAPTLESGFGMCYTGYNSAISGSFMNLSLDVTVGSVNAGKLFTLVTDTQTINISLPSAVSPNANMHLLTNAINVAKGVQVIHMDYDALLRTYFIYVRLDVGKSIVSMTETTTARAFTLSTINQTYINTLDTKVNPYTELDWTCPTVLVSSPTGDNNLSQGHWQEEQFSSGAIEVAWSQGADTLTLIKGLTAASTANTSYIATFHEDYPTSTNSFLTILLTAGTASVVEPSVTATLITNGSSVSAINYVAYTNYMGWRYVEEIDLTAVSDNVYFNEARRAPIMWGTMDGLEYVGTTTSLDPIVSSLVCYTDCCDDLTEPNNTNTLVVYSYTGTPEIWASSIQFTTNVKCNIVTATVELVPDFGSPTIVTGTPMSYHNTGCVGGFQKMLGDFNVDFASNPTGFGYNQQINLFDILGNNIGSYTKTITL